jgi:signal transduction histidine kinase
VLRAMRNVASSRDPGDPEADGPRPMPVERDPVAREPRAKRRRILVIEDDAELREAMQETLSLRGHEVMSASNGREALHRMRIVRPDLVILDLMLPVMDGWQFRAEIKRDPALADTPIVVISGSDSPTAAAVDADLYMTKPIDPRTLLHAIEDVLRGRERQLEPARIAQAERLAALGTLAAGMAHEINNPLTYVLLNLDCAMRALEVLADDDNRAKVDEVERLVQSALEGAERIRGITSGIRAFSRAEDDVRRVPLDARSVLDSALRMVMHEIRHRARLSKVYRDVPLILASEGRLGQVFLNLLTNAVQAIPEEDAGAQEIRVVTSTDGEGNAVIEISDSGCGIPTHLLGRIFEPFFTTKPIGHGTGLGLSISHGIIQSMGGEISVTSEVGTGSRFRVVIPPFKRSMAQESAHRDGGPRVVPRRRVLVVDDDRGVCEALKAALSVEHDVELAQSSQQALELIGASTQYDLILCDVHMPEVSGIGLYQQLLGARPELADRVIFMTAGTFTQRGRDFLAAADRPLLEKPLDLSAVRALLLDARD